MWNEDLLTLRSQEEGRGLRFACLGRETKSYKKVEAYESMDVRPLGWLRLMKLSRHKKC